ncbi:MAG: immunoglobulin domain-containing protein [Candidatus Acidiferrales bacterium]
MRVWNRYVGLSVALGALVWIMSGCAGSVSNSTSVDPPPPVSPSITTQPANQSVLAGATATFTVVATGTAPLSYQWQKNGANIDSATSASYTTPPTTMADTNSMFQVVVSNSVGSKTSNAAMLTVDPDPVPPNISSEPASTAVTAGQTASFSVAATGTQPLSFQWQKNGAAINGATSANYTTPPTTTADNGSTFQVTVSNSAGTMTSSPATLTVNPDPVAPNITTQPASQSVTAGQTATFSVVATGTQPLTYQWQKNGGPISGATSSSYTTPATTTADNGSTFQVVVSNSAGTASSTPATLTVNAAPVAPTITVPPANQTVTAGQTATFSVVASGTAPLGYQWQKNGSPIGGATAASYTTPATTLSDNGSTFNVVVSNSVGSTPSSSAMLTVNAGAVAPTISTQPANRTVNLGQTATFSVVASGTAPLSYQWQKNGSPIGGATSASYTTPATVATDNGATFRVVVSNTAGNATSNNATLTVQSAPGITTQPANQTVNVGQTATFSVVASGTSPLTYQWKKNGSAIGGATAASYTTPATTSTDNGATFQVVVSNPAGSTPSNSATLTVQVGPNITTQPANQTVNVGQTATFSVVASGTPPLTYQWQENGSAISGATSASYTTPPTTAADNASTFRVVVSNAAGNTPSGTASLTVQSPPSITTQPASVTVTAGQTANFSVAAAGTSPLSYQWQKNGANISGATSSSYTTPATNTSDNGATFVVNVSNPAGSISSGAATLTVNADTTPPSASITSPISGSTVGGTISITATASDNIGVASVQLQVDGANSGSADTTSPYNFSLDTTTLTNASHTLTAVATDTSGNKTTSAGISVTVANQSGGGGTPGYAGNGAGCPLSNDQNQTSDHVTQYHCPLPNPTIAGNLLVVQLRYNTPAQSPSFTDNVGGNTYQLGVSCTDNSNGVVSAIYYVQGVRAGVSDIDVHLSSTQFVQMQPYEFFNAGALDQATCQSGNGSTVSAPALNSLTTSGDLVFQQAVVDSVQQISGCTKGSQSNISWTLRSAMIADRYPSCVQYGVYNSTASFAPSFTLGTSASFITAAAAFKPAATGAAPPSGIRVVYVQHDDTDNEQAGSVPLEMPITGNMFAILFGSGCEDPSTTNCAYPTSVSDGVNNYIQVGGNVISPASDGGASVGSVWYAKGVSPGTYFPDWAMHPRSTGGNGNTMFLYDISGASSNPLDTSFGSNGLASNTGDQSTSGSGGNLTTITATPSQANEVILVTVGAGWNTFTGITSPSGGQSLSSHYGTESNSSHDDLNGGWMLYYNHSSTSAVTITWTQDESNDPGVGDWMSVGAAFH